MTNGLKIGLAITERLWSSIQLRKSTSDEMFPMVADNDARYPFIVYKRNNLQTVNQTKDGWTQDLVSFEITVVSDKYESAVSLIQIVRTLFDFNSWHSIQGDLTMNRPTITSVSEEYVNNAYVQRINYNTIVEN